MTARLCQEHILPHPFLQWNVGVIGQMIITQPWFISGLLQANKQQWGTFNTSSTTVTLPLTFRNTQYVVATNPIQAGLTVVVVTSRRTSSFDIIQHDINSAGSHNYMYLAAG